MRVACLAWDVAGPGGINTGLSGMKYAANRAGDSFVRLLCKNWVSFDRRLYDKPQTMNMGHNHLTIDADISFHTRFVKTNADWLNSNFDAVMLSYLTPHPTKNYPEPLHFELLDAIKLPIIGRVTDGMWDSYAEWGAYVAQKCIKVLVSNESYMIAVPAFVDAIAMPYFTIFKNPEEVVRKDEHSTLLWSSQWKIMKGLVPFLNALTGVPEDIPIDLCGCGIDYYQLRQSDIFRNAVGENYKDPEFSGNGRAMYYGFIRAEQMPDFYRRAGWTVDWHGLRPGRYPAYQNGSYNNTFVEALYYGALPIVADQMKKSKVPRHLYIPTPEARTHYLGNMLARTRGAMQDPVRVAQSREWAMDNHGAERGWAIIRSLLAH